MSRLAIISPQGVTGRAPVTKLLPALFSALVLANTPLASAAAAHSLTEVPAAAQPTRLPLLHVGGGFRQVSAVGQTKPPGASLDERHGTTPALDANSHRLDWLIRTSICR